MLIIIKSHELSKKMLLYSIVANIDEARKPSSWEQDGRYD